MCNFNEAHGKIQEWNDPGPDIIWFKGAHNCFANLEHTKNGTKQIYSLNPANVGDAVSQHLPFSIMTGQIVSSSIEKAQYSSGSGGCGK